MTIYAILRALLIGDRAVNDAGWVAKALAALDEAEGKPAAAAEPGAGTAELEAEIASLREQLAQAAKPQVSYPYGQSQEGAAQ